MADQQEPWSLARSLLREALALDVGIALTIPDLTAKALSQVLPELQELRGFGPSAMDAESRRVLALEGATAIIEGIGSRGTFMLVDDLQWADTTSLSILERLPQRMPDLGLVLSYRPEDLKPESGVESFLSAVHGLRRHVVEVPLGPLPIEAIHQLVSDEKLAGVVTRETDRSPLAVTELIRTLKMQRAIEHDPAGRWRARRSDAEALAVVAAQAGRDRAIKARVNAQSSEGKQLLELLALFGRQVPARLLARPCAWQEQVVLKQLDALERAGLVLVGDQGWGFVHDSIGETIAGSLANRHGRHQMIARALSTEAGETSQLAWHLARAGDHDAAADAYHRAAQLHLDRFASNEAENLAESGLGLNPARPIQVKLLEVRAEARARRGNLIGAREDLRAVLEFREIGPAKARTLARMAMLISGSEDYAEAGELIELALVEAGTDIAARAEALAVGAILDLNTDRLDRAQARSEEALVLFHELSDGGGVARIMEARAMTTFLNGHIAEGTEMFDRVARLFMDSGQLIRVPSPRANRGWGLIFLGRAEEASADIEEALELEKSLGNPEGEAYCLWLRSEALSALGRPDQAVQNAEMALAIARGLGHREFTAGAMLGLGIAWRAAGDLGRAEASFRQCLELAEGIPVYTSRAAAYLAILLAGGGDPTRAQSYVVRSLSEGTPFNQYEARWARAEVAVATRDPDAYSAVAEALKLAEEEGHAFTAVRLRQLLEAGR